MNLSKVKADIPFQVYDVTLRNCQKRSYVNVLKGRISMRFILKSNIYADAPLSRWIFILSVVT